MRKRWNTFVDTRDRSLAPLSVESGKSAGFYVERSHNGSEKPPDGEFQIGRTADHDFEMAPFSWVRIGNELIMV